jgi:hypothetical protein
MGLVYTVRVSSNLSSDSITSTPLTGLPIHWTSNPIEHLWWVLKKRMHKHYSQYNNLSQAEEEWEGFCEALKSC